MTTLVTGATGFVGSAIARTLVRSGVPVRVLVRPASIRTNIAGLPVEVVEGDITDPYSVRDAMRGVKRLYHAAADYRLYVPRPQEMFEVNVKGTANVMEAAAAEGVERVVYTSSVATLGCASSGVSADETSLGAPDDMIGPYKKSKFEAESEVRRYIDTEGLPVVIVMPSTPVGPGDVKPTPTGRMIVNAASGRMPAYVDTGLNIVHVDDVAAGHLLAMERGHVGERYILGGDNMTLKEILGRISAITGRRAPMVRLPHTLVMPVAMVSEAWANLSGRGEPQVTLDGVRMAKKHMYFSSGKAYLELGYRPREAEGAIRDAVDWFVQNGYCAGSSRMDKAPVRD